MITKTHQADCLTEVWDTSFSHQPPDYTINAVEVGGGHNRTALSKIYQNRHTGKFKDSLLAVVHNEDCIDLWVLKTVAALQELVVHYQKTHPHLSPLVVQTFEFKGDYALGPAN